MARKERRSSNKTYKASVQILTGIRQLVLLVPFGVLREKLTVGRQVQCRWILIGGSVAVPVGLGGLERARL